MKYMNFRTVSGKNGFAYYDEANKQYVLVILNDIYVFPEGEISSILIRPGYNILYALAGCVLFASAIPFAFYAVNNQALLIPSVLLLFFGISMFFSAVHEQITIISKYDQNFPEESEEKKSSITFCLRSSMHKKNIDLYSFLQQHSNFSETHILENDNAETLQEEGS